MPESVRTRIAPSPTGDPHVGTAYVALFNYALARKRGGQFVLRIEDTDRERSEGASEEMIFDALSWLGLRWDEGPDIGGPHAPYRQSERLAIYGRHAEELIRGGGAYRCFCARERLEELRSEQRAKKLDVGYDGRCRALPAAEAEQRRAAGEPHVVRLAMPRQGDTAVRDLLRGEIRFDNAGQSDPVLVKGDGYPTYHLANVVDDHLMEISHVIRAEEWISSLPKHAQLYRAFGWTPPVFCHLPLLRNADRSKISKRRNPVSLGYYRRAGILPEVLLNFLGMMGGAMPGPPPEAGAGGEGTAPVDDWEQFTLEEFVEAFELERISLGGPVFDLEKLDWLNGKYLRGLAPQQLLERLRGGILGDEYLLRVLPLVQERIERLEDFVDYAAFFFVGEVAYGEEALSRLVARKRTPAETARMLEQLMEEWVDPLLAWDEEHVEAMLRRFCDETEWSKREVFMPVRVAVTGRHETPPLFETMAVLGKEMCRRRLRAAIEALRAMEG